MDTAPRASVVALIGQTIDGQYFLKSLLGEGGMGAVYRASHADGPDVAVKVLHEELGGDADLKERFEREARALFALEHPHILGVHDFGIVDGSPYLVMELLNGVGLDTFIENTPPDPDTAIAIEKQLLTGLAFAHSKSIVHRDLKTENVFIAAQPDGDRIAKLLDFGLVKFDDDEKWGSAKKLTMAGSVMGTPAYMSPEQISGAPTDSRTDVYAAGVILCELLTEIWPFMEDTRMAMFRAHLTMPPPTLTELSESHEFAPALEDIYQKAMSKKPEDRFAGAGEMLAALDAVPGTCAWPKGERPPTPLAPLAPLGPVSSTAPEDASASAPSKLSWVIGSALLLALLAYLLFS